MSKLILTVATPEAHRDDATHMAVVHGWLQGQTPDEWQGAFTAQYQDAQGNLYRVFSLPVSEAVAQGMLGLMQLTNLERPPQDEDNLINMAAANRAHDMLRGNVWQPSPPDPETGDMPNNPVPQVDATKIVAVLGMKGVEALGAMGLQAIPSEI